MAFDTAVCEALRDSENSRTSPDILQGWGLLEGKETSSLAIDAGMRRLFTERVSRLIVWLVVASLAFNMAPAAAALVYSLPHVHRLPAPAGHPDHAGGQRAVPQLSSDHGRTSDQDLLSHLELHLAGLDHDHDHDDPPDWEPPPPGAHDHGPTSDHRHGPGQNDFVHFVSQTDAPVDADEGTTQRIRLLYGDMISPTEVGLESMACGRGTRAVADEPFKFRNPPPLLRPPRS